MLLDLLVSDLLLVFVLLGNDSHFLPVAQVLLPELHQVLDGNERVLDIAQTWLEELSYDRHSVALLALLDLSKFLLKTSLLSLIIF